MNPGKTLLKELYDFWIKEDLDYIITINQENKVFQRIREKHHNEWKIVEICRESLFENVKLISELQKRIDDVRKEIRTIK